MTVELQQQERSATLLSAKVDTSYLVKVYGYSVVCSPIVPVIKEIMAAVSTSASVSKIGTGTTKLTPDVSRTINYREVGLLVASSLKTRLNQSSIPTMLISSRPVFLLEIGIRSMGHKR
ncbi:hypothetical protein SNE40_020404 [Patella caerulea]|uniref:Uncharacterized protein n=1 Tax=Patella caerulea TaxID=87958 RepID=A0AAN8G7C0_PATCE